MDSRIRRLVIFTTVIGLTAFSLGLARYDGAGHREEVKRPASVTAAAAGSECAVEYADAEFFIEINATDGDAGVQLKLDGEGWSELEMIDPFDNVILRVLADDGPGGSVGVQGLTEFFFESAEPSFDDQTLEELLELFPEGEYRFVGRTTEGDEICGAAEFTHAIPAKPEPAVCVEDGTPRISWEPVVDPFDDPNGAIVDGDFEIDSYRVIVEALDEEGEGLETMDVELPGDGGAMSLPDEFVALSPPGLFKFEVIATEESGNQTIHEGEFAVDGLADCDDDDDDDDEPGDGDDDDDDDDDDD